MSTSYYTFAEVVDISLRLFNCKVFCLHVTQQSSPFSLSDRRLVYPFLEFSFLRRLFFYNVKSSEAVLLTFVVLLHITEGEVVV